MEDKYILDGSTLTCTKCATIEPIKAKSKTVKIQGRYACNETDSEFTNFQFPSCDSLRTCVPQLVKWNHTPSNTVKIKGSKLLRYSSTMDCGAGGQVSFVEDNQTFITAPPSILTKLSTFASGFIYLGPNSSVGCGDNSTGRMIPDIFLGVDARVPCYWHDESKAYKSKEGTLNEKAVANIWLGMNIIKANKLNPVAYPMGFVYCAGTDAYALFGSLKEFLLSKPFSIDLDSLRKAEQERMQDYLNRRMIPPTENGLPTEQAQSTSQPTLTPTSPPSPVAGPTPDVPPQPRSSQNIEQTDNSNDNFRYEQPVDVPPFRFRNWQR
jgi:Domain of unknown function (DUF4280)